MFWRLLGFSCLLLVTVPSTSNGQSYLQTFEDATIGEAVRSVGIVGAFGSYLIESNGVAGSKAFEVLVASQPQAFQSGFLPVEFAVDNIGERLTFNVDAQITLAANQISEPLTLLDLNLFGQSGNFLLGQFAVQGDQNTFTTRVFTTGPDISNINIAHEDIAALDEIGINDGVGTSIFFTFQVEIFKLDVGDYVISTAVFDIGGSPLSRGTIANINIEAIFDDFSFASIITSNWSFFDSVRFDNIGYRVSPVVQGDINLDGLVDLLDATPFIDLIASGQYQAEADVNLDGIVDLLDVQPFVGLLTGG